MKRAFVACLFSAVIPFVAAQTMVPDIAPVHDGQHVVINIPQMRLFVYTDGQLSRDYPIAVGKASTQTVLGRHKIGGKAFNPTWHIPKSIQKELNNGQTTVPPGPNNPLGPVFVRLGDPKLGLGIHGTNAPASVPGVRSHGCIRMKSPDALRFAKNIKSGSVADVVYQTVSLNADEAGNLWLAAYRDPYNKRNLNKNLLQQSIQAWADIHGLTVNAKLVNLVLKNRSGKPNCITCTAKPFKMQGSLKALAWQNGVGMTSVNFAQAQAEKEAKRQAAAAAAQSAADTEAETQQPEIENENIDENVNAMF